MLYDPDDDKNTYSAQEFCERLAYYMGLPEDQYKRITYIRFGDVIPDAGDLANNIRIDFDGGRPEFHLVAEPLILSENAARFIGGAFVTLLKRAVKGIEDGTYKPLGTIMV